MSNDLNLTVKKMIPAARENVFNAWLDAEALAKFMIPAEGMANPRVENNPVEGGSFLIVMKAGDQEIPHKGEYKSIKKFDQISFTWESMNSIANSLVTVTFDEISASETEVTLHQVGFANKESCESHKGGWGSILEKLSKTLS